MEIPEYNVSFAPEKIPVFEGNTVFGKIFAGYLINNRWGREFIDYSHEYIFRIHHPYLQSISIPMNQLYRIESNGDLEHARIHLEKFSSKFGEFIPFHLERMEPYVWGTNSGKYVVRMLNSDIQVGTTFDSLYNAFRFAAYAQKHNFDMEHLHHPRREGMHRNNEVVNELFNDYYWEKDEVLFSELDVFYGYAPSKIDELERRITELEKQKEITPHQMKKV